MRLGRRAGKEPASQPAHTTPPALGEKAPRCSHLATGRAGRELGGEPGGEQQLQLIRAERLRAAGGRRVGRRAGPARCRAGCTPGGWARRSRAGAAPPRMPRLPPLQRGPALAQGRVGVPACPPALIVDSSPRPSWSTRSTRLSGSSRPPRRERTRLDPLGHRTHAPTVGRVQMPARDRPLRSESSAALRLPVLYVPGTS